MSSAVSICVREKYSSIKGEERKWRQKERKEGEIKHELYTTWIIAEINQSLTILTKHFFSIGYCFFNNVGIFKETEDAEKYDHGG